MFSLGPPAALPGKIEISEGASKDVFVRSLGVCFIWCVCTLKGGFTNMAGWLPCFYWVSR